MLSSDGFSEWCYLILFWIPYLIVEDHEALNLSGVDQEVHGPRFSAQADEEETHGHRIFIGKTSIDMPRPNSTLKKYGCNFEIMPCTQ